MRKCVLVLGSARTGTSAVARILHEHGAFISDATKQAKASFGYQTYEMQEIRKICKSHWLISKENGSKWGKPVTPTPEALSDISDSVEQIVPDGETWLMKCTAEWYPYFEQFDPTLVFVYRNRQGMLDSVVAKNMHVDKAEVVKLFVKRVAIMYSINKPGTWVDTDKLFAGDHEGIEQAVTAAGFEYSESVVQSAYMPHLWKQRQKV